MTAMTSESDAGPNADQIRYWNDESGPKWVALHSTIDDQIAPLGLAAIERADVRAGESVLDIGCGCGATSLQLAERVGPGGSVTGLDVSEPMLARARERADECGLAQLEFVSGDAQTFAFEAGSHDLVFSRFGVMFFQDPTAAFANLRTALRPGGRVAFACWQEVGRNAWMLVPLMAAAKHVPLPAPPAAGGPGPFAFADPEHVRGILAAAGFADIEVASHEADLTLAGGGDLEQVVDFVLQMGPAGQAMRESDGSTRAKAREAVQEALQPHLTPDGVRLASATWIVSASNPTPGLRKTPLTTEDASRRSR
jgi:SAM-dependent methyltransferase